MKIGISTLAKPDDLPVPYRALAAAVVVEALKDLKVKTRDPGRWATAVIFLTDPAGADSLCEELGLPPDPLAAWKKKTGRVGFKIGGYRCSSRGKR